MGFDYSEFVGEGNPNYKTGLAIAVNGKRSSIYGTWQNMKQRCLNPKNHKYARYGGRGIKLCSDWITIQGFIDWAYKSGWSEGMTIDRKNNDGNYEPKNCRWLSVAENSRKKSTTKLSMRQATKIRDALELGVSHKKLADKYQVSKTLISAIKYGTCHMPEGMRKKKFKD